MENKSPFLYRKSYARHLPCCRLSSAVLEQYAKTFLSEIGLTEENGLSNFNLAPLEVRRDISMLGLIHRTVLGKGPAHFQKFFALTHETVGRATRRGAAKHSRQLNDNLHGSLLDMGRRSALGLIPVYNLLPQSVVDNDSVSSFQAALQDLVKREAQAGIAFWKVT